MVIARYLRNAWLWDQVRVQGGAYGAFCLFDRISGALSFVSYRDPNLLQTLAAFDQSSRFLREHRLEKKELDKSIIGTIGDLDAHMLPDTKGYVAMVRHLVNDTEEDRQRMREEILGTRASDFKAFARLLDQVKDQGIVKVLGAAAALRALQEQQKELNLTKVL